MAEEGQCAYHHRTCRRRAGPNAIAATDIRNAIFVGSIVVLGACGDQATLPESPVGPSPQLPPPHATLIPTVNIAPVKGWPKGATPVAAPGLRVAAFAESLDHPRWLYVLANGDVLVAERVMRPSSLMTIKGSRGGSRV